MQEGAISLDQRADTWPQPESVKMPNPWNGYATVNDDLRHTWERAAYGRPVTGNLTETDVPGMAAKPAAKETAPPAPSAPADTVRATDSHGTEPTHEERQSAATAYAHAENAPGIRREIEEGGPDARPYQSADAPALEARGGASREALYGQAPAKLETGGMASASDLYGQSPSSGAEAGSVWGKDADPGRSELTHADLYGEGLETKGADTARPEATRADLYGQGMETKDNDDGNVWGKSQPDSSAPTQPNQGNDMTPG